MASSAFSLVAPAIVTYGYAVTIRQSTVGGSLRGNVAAALAALVPAVALGAASGAQGALAAAIECLATLATAALLVSGRMTPGAGCLVVGASAASQLAADAALAAVGGTTLGAVMSSLIDDYLGQLSGVVAAGSGTALAELGYVLALVWPVSYVVQSLGWFLVAHLGAWLVSSRVTAPPLRLPSQAAYDLPLWVVGVLVATVAALAAAVSVPALSARPLLMASVNVLLALRFALAAQGLAVLTWVARRHQLKSPSGVLLAAAALILELQFFVLTFVGLVDVWANFRHLRRGQGSRPGQRDPAMQDKKSARAD